MRILAIATLLLFSVLSLPLISEPKPAAETAVWPQWRGPTRDGVVHPDQPWPPSLKGLRQVWHVDLAAGYPGPIVAGDRVFTVESVNGKETARALDRATGKELWSATWAGETGVPFFAARNGNWVRSTPAFDGHDLFIGGMRDLLVCLDGVTGKERWRVDFVDRYKTHVPAFGFVCSPLVTDDAVYVQAGAAVVRVSKTTGETVWRSLEDRSNMGSAFSSPLMAKIAGREQLLVQSRKLLAGLDPASGAVLWSVPIPAFQGMNIFTPIPFREGVFTASYGGAAVLYNIAQNKETFAAALAWNLPIQGYMSTPVVIDGHAYVQRRDLKLSCVDLSAGKELWTIKPEFGDYASLVTDGHKILALAQTGDLVLFQDNPAKFDVLDRKHISDQETWGHLAICGREIYVRELKGLSKFVWDDEPAK